MVLVGSPSFLITEYGAWRCTSESSLELQVPTAGRLQPVYVGANTYSGTPATTDRSRRAESHAHKS